MFKFIVAWIIFLEVIKLKIALLICKEIVGIRHDAFTRYFVTAFINKIRRRWYLLQRILRSYTGLIFIQENIFIIFLIKLIVLLKYVFIFRIFDHIFALLVSMCQVIKQSSIKELVNSFRIVWKDHLKQFSDAWLYHRRVNWIIRLNENSVDWEKEIFHDNQRNILTHFASDDGLVKLNYFYVQYLWVNCT